MISNKCTKLPIYPYARVWVLQAESSVYRPYQIIGRIGPIAYILDLPNELSRIHNVFHMFMLRKYVYDLSYVLKDLPVYIEENLTYEEQSVEILDKRDQVLRTKIIPLINVLWRNQSYDEATCEKDVQAQYPHLFNAVGK